MTSLAPIIPESSIHLSSIGEGGSLTPSQIIDSLNARGFVVSIFQGAFSSGGVVDTKCPKYLWHGSIYSADRHEACAKLRRELPYEELIKHEAFFYQLVAHHEESYEECLEALWQQYLSPTVPPRAVRSSPNPAFLRHKKKASQPITDDDLLA